MTNIPEVDLPITELIIGKIVVIYTANNKGEFPNSFTKAFIPSSISLSNDWYVGYTPHIIDGFNMVEIPDIIAKGLQSYNVINGVTKKYDMYTVLNDGGKKLLIDMNAEELLNQLNSKKFLINSELTRIYDIKIKELYISYGRESDTWTTQLSEAKEFTLDSTAIVPFIANMATIRGIELSDLVATILEKAKIFSLAISTLIGNKQLFSDRVSTSSTDLSLNTIITEIGNV